MRVQVDLARCENNGVCTTIAPAVFELDDDDQLRVLQREPSEALAANVADAAAHCPTQAITIVNV